MPQQGDLSSHALGSENKNWGAASVRRVQGHMQHCSYPKSSSDIVLLCSLLELAARWKPMVWTSEQLCCLHRYPALAAGTRAQSNLFWSSPGKRSCHTMCVTISGVRKLIELMSTFERTV